MSARVVLLPSGSEAGDAETVRRICDGEVELFPTLLRRYNQRLFRIARAVVRDDAEAEDAVQETWVRAFTRLPELHERERLASWLSRIAFREAVARVRRRRFSAAFRPLPDADAAQELPSARRDPEEEAASTEASSRLRTAIDGLPSPYRTVFVMRELEGLSTSETAECLGVSADVVKTRLHRARGLLRRKLAATACGLGASVYRFLGERCERLAARVLARLAIVRPRATAGPTLDDRTGCFPLLREEESGE